MPAIGNARPFTLHELDGEKLTLEGAVYQALGAASVCWEHPGAAGTFDPEQAREIGDVLLAFIRDRFAALLAADRSETRRLAALEAERVMNPKIP